MKGDVRCVEGRLMRHDPQYDDPDLETNLGECPECEGAGCSPAYEITKSDGEQVVRDTERRVWLEAAEIVETLPLTLPESKYSKDDELLIRAGETGTRGAIATALRARAGKGEGE